MRAATADTGKQNEQPTFNSEHSKQITAEESDAWATEYQEAARALKALALDLIRRRQIIGDKAFAGEVKRLEV